MDAKKIVLLVGALFVAAITAVMAKRMSDTTVAPTAMAMPMIAQPTGPQVLVATRTLPVGTILGPDAMKFQTWPKDMIDGAYFVKDAAGVDPAKMTGMVVRYAITGGQPVTQGALVSPGDRGFLAAALTPGMRAVAMSVTGAATVAGFIFPGDRVDVVLSQDVPGVGDGALPVKAAETIARNIRVLATDQRTDHQPDTSTGKTDVKDFSLVTVEATPKLAEEIAVAQRMGTLSLSLRPLADDTRTLATATAAGGSQTVTVPAMPQAGRGTFTTGNEISRFAKLGKADTGPVVRVARGTTLTAAPIGAGVANAGTAVAGAVSTGGAM